MHIHRFLLPSYISIVTLIAFSSFLSQIVICKAIESLIVFYRIYFFIDTAYCFRIFIVLALPFQGHAHVFNISFLFVIFSVKFLISIFRIHSSSSTINYVLKMKWVGILIGPSGQSLVSKRCKAVTFCLIKLLAW